MEERICCCCRGLCLPPSVILSAISSPKEANEKTIQSFVFWRRSFASRIIATSAISSSETKEKKYDAIYYLKSALAGGIGMSITHGAMTPVYVVKTRIQLDSVKYNKGMVGTFRQIIAEEGAGALLTGFGPTVVGSFVQGWFKFGGVEFFKINLAQAVGEKSAWENRIGIYLGAAALAEFVADIFLCPLEATRIRLVSNPQFASGLVSAAARLYKEEGIIKGFYSEFGPILFKQIPYTMAKFSVQGWAAEQIATVMNVNLSEITGSTKFGISLGSGVIAGVASAIISHPLYILPRLWPIARKSGILKLWTVGLGTRCMIVSTLTAGQFLFFDLIMDFVGAEKFHFHNPPRQSE